MEDEIIKFNATITYQRYYNYDSTWGVFGFSTDDDIPYYIKETNSNSSKKLSSLAGKMQELVVGAEYLVKAKYKKDKVYGDQYEPIVVYAVIPQTREKQLLFLKSLIAESIAENLIDAYPNVVNDVANGTLKEIDYSKVKGVRETTWNRIKEKIINNYLISDIITMLKPLGITYTMIKKLLSEEPNPTLLKQEIDNNPYTLCRISGLGFKRVDDFALKLKPERIDSIERLAAFTKYYFTELGENEGHTWCSESIFKSAVTNNIPECYDKIKWLISNNDFLYIDNEKVGLKYYHDIEMKIYNIILEKTKTSINQNLNHSIVINAIKLAEKEQGFEYTNEQIELIKKVLDSPISFITGRAGTGKTSIIRGIIKSYTENHKNVVASALSAMAAQRITEASGYPAATIHRTLGCQGFNKFMYNKDNKLIVDVAFLDEGSMVNASLFLTWLEAIPDNASIIISGDFRQLPPIGYGNIFSDLITSFKNTNIVNELTKPMRQATKSGILVDANLICDNYNPVSNPSPKIIHGELNDMYYMFRDNRQSLFDIAIKTFFKSVETDGIDNVVIAVPRRNGCLNSAYELNKVIQEKLLHDEEKTIVGFENSFKLGAKVMQTVNDYQKNVFNGEIGYITNIDSRKNGNKTEQYCVVTFKNTNNEEKNIEYTKRELSTLDLAYANTVHKLQGSGKKTVIGIIDSTHYQLLDSCMLYTLLTRAKKRCLLLSEPQAFLKCIRTSHNNRNTWLNMVN